MTAIKTQPIHFPNTRATLARVLGAFVLTGLLCAIAGGCVLAAHYRRPIHPTTRVLAILALVIGGLSIAFSIAYFAFRAEARRIDRCRAAIAAGKFLVRWRYSRETWARYRDSCRDREWNHWWIMVGIVGGAGLLLAGIAVLMLVLPESVESGHRPTHGIMAVFFLAMAAFAGLVTLAYVLITGSHRQLMETPQDSFVSTQGAYANGKWIVWGHAFQKLLNVQVVPGAEESPAAIEISISDCNNVTRHVITIPEGQEALAERVVHAVIHAPDAAAGGGATGVFTLFNAVRVLLRSFVS